MGVSDFLVSQLVHENIQYFSCKMQKGQFLSQVMMDNKKGCATKLLICQSSSLTVYFLPGLDVELGGQSLVCSFLTRCTDNDKT